MTTTAPAPTVRITRLTRADLEFSAALHAAALPHGFFARLGPRFLATYHTTFLTSPHGVALAARRGGQPVGMLVGTVANTAHYRFVLREHGVLLALLAFAALSVRPQVALAFVRTRLLRYVRATLRLARRRLDHAGDATTTAPAQQVAVLTHVAVAPEARGLGAGKALVAAFEQDAAERGADVAHLVTARASQRNHRFYTGCGWRHMGDDVDRDGRAISRFMRELR